MNVYLQQPYDNYPWGHPQRVIHHKMVKCPVCHTMYCPICTPDHYKIHQPIIVHDPPGPYWYDNPLRPYCTGQGRSQ
jgi:hypothetical protein